MDVKSVLRLATNKQYQSARTILLLSVILSAVNTVAALFGYVILFSSSYPLAVTYWLCSADVAHGFWEILIFVILPAFLSLLPYLLCWLFTRYSPIPMVLAAALLVLDTLMLLIGFSWGRILNLMFHFLILGCLFYGIHFSGGLFHSHKGAM